MRAIPLKVIDTDMVRMKDSLQSVEFRSDSPSFNLKFHEVVPFSYRDALREIVRQPINPQAGMDADDLDHALKILRVVKKARDGDTIRLEDDDYAYLKRKIESARWIVAEEWLDEFRQDILAAATITAEEIDDALDTYKGTLVHATLRRKAAG